MMEKERIIKWGISSLIFISSFILYVLTLYPSIGPRDSSEYALASYVLGVPHPSGYPLLVMFGKLFMFLPYGEFAFRANMVSALFSSLTILLAFTIIQYMTRNYIAAILGSLTLAFSYLYWIYSVHFEVFTMNSFFMLLSFYLLLLWSGARDERRVKYLYLFCFIFGLSISHHHVILLSVPAYLYYIYVNDNKVFKDPKLLSRSFIVLLIGLSPLLYLPIRAASDPMLNWGNPDNISRFIEVVTRAEFGWGKLSVPYLPSYDAINMLRHLWVYIRQLADQFTLFGIIIGMMSFVRLFKSGSNKHGIALLLLFVMNGLFFAFMINRTRIDFNLLALSERFYLSSFVVFSILIGIGYDYLYGVSIKQKQIFKYVLISALFVLPVFLLANNYRDCDMSSNYILHDLPLNVLSALPENSVLYSVNDSIRFGIWYMQGVYNIRPDVAVIWPFQPPWYRQQLARKYKGISVLPTNIEPPQLEERNYYVDVYGGLFKSIYNHLSPEGLIYKVGLVPVTSLNSAKAGRAGLTDKYRYRGIYNTRSHRDMFTREVVLWYGEAFDNIGAVFHDNGDLDEAKEMYGKAVDIIPDSHVAYFNLALIYKDRTDYMKAIQMFKVAAEKDPAFIESYKQLGVLYANNLYDTRNAVEYFEKYLSFNPQGEDVEAISNYLTANKERFKSD